MCNPLYLDEGHTKGGKYDASKGNNKAHNQLEKEELEEDKARKQLYKENEEHRQRTKNVVKKK